MAAEKQAAGTTGATLSGKVGCCHCTYQLEGQESWALTMGTNGGKRYVIEGAPNQDQLFRIRLLCERVFEPLRIYLGVPIFISSCFRSAALNVILGGARGSQHMANNGAAMDLDAQIFGGTTNKEIGDFIKDHLEFDQLIYEGIDGDDYAWIHVSYNEGKNRNEVLVMEHKNGKTTYRPY